jgi:predicted  nucleic acid-binding Zn-ribbon protein
MNGNENSSSSGASRILVPVLIGAIVALAAATVYLFVQLDGMRTEVAGMRQSVQTEVSKLQDASSLLDSANRRNVDALREELETAKKTAASAVGQVKVDAQKHAEDLARKLEAEQKRQQQQVTTELSAVKEAASTTNTKIADVSTEVSSVRTEVANTKSELDKTIAELKSVRGDLGVQSGLIATNGKELGALKALGDRNYYEFKLAKNKKMEKVGSVSMRLTNADTKKNKYTIQLIADDKQVEKKDKNVNEPLQFYVAGARTPYEIVVNQISKDLIVGYMATPKGPAR